MYIEEKFKKIAEKHLNHTAHCEIFGFIQNTVMDDWLGINPSGPPPSPVNPSAAAGAQVATNVGTALAQNQMNMVNQETPYGTLKYVERGVYDYTDPNSGKTYSIPQYTARQELSPLGQRLQDLAGQQQINLSTIARDQSGKISDLLSNAYDPSGLPRARTIDDVQFGSYEDLGASPEMAKFLQSQRGALPSGVADAGSITRGYGGDFSEDRRRVEDAIMSRLDPKFDRDEEALRTRLANQGLRPGSEAFKREMDAMRRARTDARMQAILAGGQEQTRLDNLAARRAAFQNQAQAQQRAQNYQDAAFGAQMQGRRFDQGGLIAQLMGQDFNNRMNRTNYNNRLVDQRTNQGLQQYNAGNQERRMRLNEDIQLRNLPINEISALSRGTQIKDPNFVSTNVAQMPNINIGNMMYDSYNQQLDAWKTRKNEANQGMAAYADLFKSVF